MTLTCIKTKSSPGKTVNSFNTKIRYKSSLKRNKWTNRDWTFRSHSHIPNNKTTITSNFKFKTNQQKQTKSRASKSNQIPYSRILPTNIALSMSKSLTIRSKSWIGIKKTYWMHTTTQIYTFSTSSKRTNLILRFCQ
jgi:hypothetical protein